ncbi:MAG: cell division protein ZapE [Planctomycetota bacterium]|nr:MAG: cell division protein ZapE [Planctomycetota bacterium]
MTCSLHGESISLEALRDQLANASQQAEWKPPPRFREKTFANYRIDPEVPGQAEAVTEVMRFAAAAKRGITNVFRRRGRRGCYLDGDFGVGKTHLLAAAWHAAPGSRSYVSFAEAINHSVRHGPEATVRSLAADLVCIDEFELDDPSNTRMADLICHGLAKAGCRLLVTSNTVPGELGVGRLFVDQFRAQLVRISDLFSDVHVPGRDYRQRRHDQHLGLLRWGAEADLAGARHSLSLTATSLDQLLMMVPIIHLRALGRFISHLEIRNVHTFPDQLAALRFVNLVDRVYDQCITVSVQADCAIDEVFHPDYRDWAFAKKYRRCISRLREACREDIRRELLP